MIFSEQGTGLRATLLFLLCGLICLSASPGAAEEQRPTIRGEVAYAEPVQFDYNRDGTQETIQLWASFTLKPAVGKKGEPGFLPEEGHLRRYMKDLSLGRPVIGYNAFNMLPDNPLGEEVPATEIQLQGNTVTFKAGLLYTVVVGGEGLEHDSITVNDGIRQYPVHLLAGEIKISGTAHGQQ